MLLPAIVCCFAILLESRRAQSQLAACAHASDAAQVANALRRIEQSIDPCGESAQVIAVLESLRRCKATYQICTEPMIDRNVFDRPAGGPGDTSPRTISWNPSLRSELDKGCDGDPNRPVLRDPTASLLHELVHAAHDCQGVNPGEHEIEAVRIENIYRRAAGLCQRVRYGEEPLPSELLKTCMPGYCPCTAPANPGELVRDQSPFGQQPGNNPATERVRLGDAKRLSAGPQ